MRRTVNRSSTAKTGHRRLPSPTYCIVHFGPLMDDGLVGGRDKGHSRDGDTLKVVVIPQVPAQARSAPIDISPDQRKV